MRLAMGERAAYFIINLFGNRHPVLLIPLCYS
ncbi:MAG: hypothetical protein ACI9U0_000776 [Flavobacteriales bacterium]|mgnify:FL=1|jgi:hypothetical protein